MTEKSTVSTSKIAALLGANRQTVQRMLERGEIAGTRAGRNWKIPRSELERLEKELNSRGVVS
jgi:excisionase family DNA binding protein